MIKFFTVLFFLFSLTAPGFSMEEPKIEGDTPAASYAPLAAATSPVLCLSEEATSSNSSSSVATAAVPSSKDERVEVSEGGRNHFDTLPEEILSHILCGFFVDAAFYKDMCLVSHQFLKHIKYNLKHVKDKRLTYYSWHLENTHLNNDRFREELKEAAPHLNHLTVLARTLTRFLPILSEHKINLKSLTVKNKRKLRVSHAELGYFLQFNTNLQELHISGCQWTPHLETLFANIGQNIKILMVRGVGLKQKMLNSYLKTAEHLEELDISYNSELYTLPALPKGNQLRVLKAYHTRIHKGSVVNFLTSATHLYHFYLPCEVGQRIDRQDEFSGTIGYFHKLENVCSNSL
ncbi:hypothetical protein [Candidatus Finniella inopinata]|uniref:Uncharacterized protein n=1 Tax=Candidatus Finniella inopinata TaxID=1696036 RepID=A0A4V2DZI7_9PROT|nr:hypothetical protein [Candidatus Finniella inopinata]RZI45197.1 hypothetical protein EQU50_07905 [Candidatus Finniella inopinata]